MTRRGWATSSFERAVRWAFLAGIVVWTPVVVAAYVAGPERHHDATFTVMVNVALLALAVGGCLSRRVPAWWVFRIQHVVFVFDWAQTTGPSTPFAVATYQVFIFATVAEGLTMRRRAHVVFSVLWCLALPVCVYLVQPSYGVQVPLTVAVTGPLLLAVSQPGVTPLLRFARSVDKNHDQSVRALVRLDAQAATVRRAAEEQRQVHDTAINTLAAIARGGSAVVDVEAVRDRCRADTAVLEQLISASALGVVAPAPPDEPRARRTIGVVMPGLSGIPLAGFWEGLPLGVRSALGGAIGELVTNAEKHSGAAEVSVDIRGDDGHGVRVVVRDEGCGFAPAQIVQRGLASSVRDRLADEGIGLDLRTAPGEGVRATMTWRPTAARGPAEGADFRHDVDQIRMIGALLMLLLAGTGGIAEGALNHPGELTPDYLLCAVVLATAWLSWRGWRRHGRLTRTAAAALVVVAPVTFLISGWSVDFGGGYNLAWQALAASFSLFVLVAGTRSSRLVGTGMAAYAATAVTAALVLADSEAAATTTLVVGATGLVWVGGWAACNRKLGRMASRAVREHEQAVRADETAEAQAVAALIRARWRLAGIEDAACLLRELGCTLDPASPEARRRCGTEETYLRQLILLPPELVNIGGWICQALSTARERDVNLKIRAGVADVGSATAERWGQYLIDATAAVEPGTDLVVSLFDAGDGLQLRMVADDPRVAALARGRDWGAEVELEIQQFAEQLLVRVGPA